MILICDDRKKLMKKWALSYNTELFLIILRPIENIGKKNIFHMALSNMRQCFPLKLIFKDLLNQFYSMQQ